MYEPCHTQALDLYNLNTAKKDREDYQAKTCILKHLLTDQPTYVNW